MESRAVSGTLAGAMELEAPPSGKEGVEFLCAKFSSLISRLRQESLAREGAQAEARQLEARLQSEALQWSAARRQLEEERSALQEELRELKASSQGASPARPASGAAGGEALLRQGEELSALRREHSGLLSQHRAVYDELVTCRQNLARCRRTAAELEGKASTAAREREEAEVRSRGLQDEMRKALRAASAARNGERAAALSAGRGEKEARSRDARLAAVRRQGQRDARRAESAERRLCDAQGLEATAERLARQNRELQLRLDQELQQKQGDRLDAARAEAAEARSAAELGEIRGELRARDALAEASRQRAAELEQELSRARANLEKLGREHAARGSAEEELRLALHAAASERDEALAARDRLAAELGENRRRADRGAPQLAECRRKLGGAEVALERARSEVAEERRARERCHLEAVRTGEKLRQAHGRVEQLRDRVRRLEEAAMRYPSRRLARETAAWPAERAGRACETEQEACGASPRPLARRHSSAGCLGSAAGGHPESDASARCGAWLAGPTASGEDLPRSTTPMQTRLGGLEAPGTPAAPPPAAPAPAPAAASAGRGAAARTPQRVPTFPLHGQPAPSGEGSPPPPRDDVLRTSLEDSYNALNLLFANDTGGADPPGGGHRPAAGAAAGELEELLSAQPRVLRLPAAAAPETAMKEPRAAGGAADGFHLDLMPPGSSGGA